MKPEMFTIEEAMRCLKKSRATLDRWRRKGIGPIWRMSGERVVYLKCSVVDYAALSPSDHLDNPFTEDDVVRHQSSVVGEENGVLRKDRPAVWK